MMRWVVVAVMMLTAALMAGVAPSAQAAERPNVVVVMTDDMPRATLRYLEKTRRLLGDGGVEFERYYAAWPLCCPARATHLTGQFQHNHGVRGNQPPNGSVVALRGQDETLPVWLQRAGYHTAHVGKFLNGYGHYGDA